MSRAVRLVDFALGVEGVALLRTLFDANPDARAARLAEIDRLTSDEKLGALALDFPERSPTAGYAEWSEFYDEMPNPLIEGEQQAMDSLLHELVPGRALDAACGTGRITTLLAALGHDVVATDITPAMLAVARQKLPAIDFRVADLLDLPFDDGMFDVVTCSLALAHLETPDPAVEELARVTAPGGHIIISDIHPMAVLLGGHASYMGANGTAGVIHQYVHLPSTYLESFERAHVRVARCLEPLHDGRTVAKVPSFDLVPNATRAAFIGIPVAIVWKLERPR